MTQDSVPRQIDMRRYSKWMVASSLVMLAISFTNFTIPHTPTERLDYGGGPPPIEPWKFDSIVLAVLAVIIAAIAVGLWKQGSQGCEGRSREILSKLSYGLLLLTTFEFVLGLVVAAAAYDITYGTRFGDVDFPHAPPWHTFWNSFRPMFCATFWAALALEWKRPGKYSVLIAASCCALVIFSYAAVYREFYCAYLNIRQFGSDFKFVSYWSSGDWDLIRAPLLVAALILWAHLGFGKARRG